MCYITDPSNHKTFVPCPLCNKPVEDPEELKRGVRYLSPTCKCQPDDFRKRLKELMRENSSLTSTIANVRRALNRN